MFSVNKILTKFLRPSINISSVYRGRAQYAPVPPLFFIKICMILLIVKTKLWCHVNNVVPIDNKDKILVTLCN